MDGRPRYDLIIFDCDGVLIDSEVLSCRALVDCFGRHGFDVDLDLVYERLLGRSPRAIEDYCKAQGRGLPESFMAEFRAAVRAAFAADLVTLPDAARLLRSLETPFCVASSSDLDRMEFSLALAGLAPLVEGRIFSAQAVRRGKPAPDLFLHAASAMGAEPSRALVIEDSVSGVEAGKRAGMTVWGFVGGSHYAMRDGSAILRAAGADHVFDRLADLERADCGAERHAAR